MESLMNVQNAEQSCHLKSWIFAGAESNALTVATVS